MDIDKSEVNKSPLAAFRTLGALTEVTLKAKPELESFVNTLTIVSSMPARFPALSSIGTVQIMRKVAKGEMVLYELLFGVK
jgi:hypothetical protein